MNNTHDTGPNRSAVGIEPIWRCGICSEAVDRSEGELGVSHLELTTATRVRLRAGEPDATDEERVAHPDVVRWFARHYICGLAMGPSGHYLTYPLPATERALLDLSLELASHRWIALTDWSQFATASLGADA